MSAGVNYSLPENIFQVIFEKSPGSILVSADIPRFTILAVNDSYLKITATKREDITGKGFFEVFPDDGTQTNDPAAARNIFTEVITGGKKIDIPTYKYDVYDHVTGQHEPRFWSCSNIPIMGNDGKIAYILNTVTDITAEVRAKETAIESESRLRIATAATGLATWELSLKDQQFISSPRLAEIFGHSPGANVSLLDIRSQVNPDDMKNIVRKSYLRALVTGDYLYEVSITWHDGSAHWIKTQGVVLFGRDGKPQRMLGTVLDITESKRDEIRKNDFIAMASHELKTPLTSVKAYLQLLTAKIKKSDDAFINNALVKANNQVNKMSDLIYGFLDLSRLESGKLQLKTEHFDINELLEETITETMQVNYNHKIIFKPKEAIMVNADREKIGQVVGNLLSNAIKYSSKENTITINSKIIGDVVQVAVIDKGIGIKPKDQEKLFQRFYRVESEKIKNISGFGIGLYLASEIVQRHKGKIWVKSAENKGSAFYFSLPCLSS